jgi:hypothetical protein
MIVATVAGSGGPGRAPDVAGSGEPSSTADADGAEVEEPEATVGV